MAIDTGTTASVPLRLQYSRIAIAELTPDTALSDSAFGPLRFRVVQDGVAGDWQPLGTLVRLPSLTAVSCSRAPATCVLRGTGMFVIGSVSGGNGGASAVHVPDGFTGSSIEVPRPSTGSLTITLRDAPGATATLPVSN